MWLKLLSSFLTRKRLCLSKGWDWGRADSHLLHCGPCSTRSWKSSAAGQKNADVSSDFCDSCPFFSFRELPCFTLLNIFLFFFFKTSLMLVLLQTWDHPIFVTRWLYQAFQTLDHCWRPTFEHCNRWHVLTLTNLCMTVRNVYCMNKLLDVQYCSQVVKHCAYLWATWPVFASFLLPCSHF